MRCNQYQVNNSRGRQLCDPSISSIRVERNLQSFDPDGTVSPNWRHRSSSQIEQCRWTLVPGGTDSASCRPRCFPVPPDRSDRSLPLMARWGKISPTAGGTVPEIFRYRRSHGIADSATPWSVCGDDGVLRQHAKSSKVIKLSTCCPQAIPGLIATAPCLVSVRALLRTHAAVWVGQSGG